MPHDFNNRIIIIIAIRLNMLKNIKPSKVVNILVKGYKTTCPTKGDRVAG